MRRPNLRLVPGPPGLSPTRVFDKTIEEEQAWPQLLVPRRRVELVSQGIDAALQGLAGDPYNGTTSVGLRVPAHVTTGAVNRYLFMLCHFRLPEGINGWVRGFRQGWSLGTRLNVN